jgi:hypothetical protein
MEFTTGNRIKKPQERIESSAAPAFATRLSREDFLRAYMNDRELKRIPWKEIWELLRTAKMRGNTPMIDTFYDTLFKEARFDDTGAWTKPLTKKF